MEDRCGHRSNDLQDEILEQLVFIVSVEAVCIFKHLYTTCFILTLDHEFAEKKGWQ